MKKQRILYFDLLNICACFCVICLHCNGLAHTYSNTLAWKQALAVEVIAYWAVPIFFMLSGATLMKYRNRYDTKTFLKKRFIRTVIPFVFWSIINIFWKQYLGNINITTWGKRAFINNFFNTYIENVYWFFIPLFAVYLCMPLLSLLTEEKHRKTLWYIVTVAFIFQSFLPVLFSVLRLNYNYDLNIPVATGYVIFVILGYLLSTQEIHKKQKYIIYVLGIFGITIRYGAIYYLSTRDQAINKTFFGYTAFYSVFLAVAVFVLFKQVNWHKVFKTEKSINIITKISSCSFGIYLIHMIVFRFATNILKIPSCCWQWRIIAPFVIYFTALIIIYIMKKIPILKNIVP